ncbi:MAG: bifunctional diaminohydroxyphosphoribosylaminopyrimidine deaminase/5-amino-6-(5-phosphoribosylamino)uracil reductase RibD [Rhodospirillales bacterium]|nr:bifunctional diaminohydroxyphosphoribosylaminopyrimidine deaminase/5-amino-6-(5-phosphoribosylamino)uracil reductase RibD [Alphaproteobacteria bacterium]MCB1839716.1 bifunctional diaminohydroxyphosphoribosylaminopyrimidine deaminase/5-amino-6-(5-phosphoribosylamino)uracil reductase RibD [Alphaproteobacteria bacterium]MCB9976019.1 bifunctional diaminohydroxyphosphoribosylaminopyrimidine deaminase/5-amino-6-(5-phosphoribosylamino)uracil reductase RibD [Rhodospirillales bacterium]
MDTDRRHMLAALHMARRGLGRVWPNPSVGCVIIKDGRMVGTARTANGGRPHAETLALQQAGQEAKGAVVYVTLEPCAHEGATPPCVDALIRAEVKRVVIGTVDPDPRTAGKGIKKLQEAGIETALGILEEECWQINQGFFLRITEHRPLIALKAACTQSGQLSPREGRWISGREALNHVHLERSKYDAILIGIGTALADDPMLTVRLPGLSHQPVRVVLDSGLRLRLESRLVKSAKTVPLWVIYAEADGIREKALQEQEVKLFKTTRHSLKEVVKRLAEEGITRLLVEGGPTIHGAFMKEGLCDQMSVYRSQEMSEGRGEALFAPPALESYRKKQGLALLKTRRIEQDLLEIYSRKV